MISPQFSFSQALAAKTWLLAGQTNLRAAGVGGVGGKGHDASTHVRAHGQTLATRAAFDDAGADVDVDHVLHDLGFVEESLHRPDADEGTEFVDFRDGTLDNLVIFHAEDDGVELDLLVDGAVAVNDAAAADGFVVGGDEDEAVLLVKSTFKGGHRQAVDVLVERSATAHVLRRNTDGVLFADDFVHRKFPPGSLHGPGTGSVRHRQKPLEGATEVDLPSVNPYMKRTVTALSICRAGARSLPSSHQTHNNLARPTLLDGSPISAVAGRKGGGNLLLLMFLLPLGMGLVQPQALPSMLQPSAVEEGAEAPAQPWPQYMGSANKNGSMPLHAPGGGPGMGSVANVSVLGTIDDPVLNWVGSENGGTTAYGSLVLDLSANIERSAAAMERCANGDMFALVIDSSDGSEHIMRLVTGDDAKIAWEVNLGASETMRATPVVADIDGDGDVEIIVSKDTNSGLDVQAWSPELECDASGWVRTGHSNERLWTWSDADYSLSAPSPHLPSSQSGHRAVTQPLLSDVDLDGAQDLVLAVVDEGTDDPTLIALPMSGTTPSAPLWEVALDRGTHPSDPTAVRIDASNVDVVLTTIDASSGAMWAWKVDGGNGALDWERAPVPGTDSDQDAPRLRLPGPVIVQLDADAEPEVILTVPTDPNGRTSGSGARFVAMELTSTTEIFSFRAPNGYADAPPLPVDTDDDGVHDRLCWVTWYSTSATSFNRQGMAGCHDITADPPIKEWSRTMERGSGNDNDEIAVAPPLWIDVDADGPAELLVAFGRKLHCFDGETGAPTDVSTPWEDPVSLPHRTWAAPAAADMDGDGHLDILIGDMLVSQRQADLEVLSDGRALFFTPADPDPGEAYTVSARFENVGTEAALDDVDAVLLKDDVVISRYRLDDLEPIDPSGEGTTASFSVGLTASLGTSEFRLVLDPNNNITEAREDNNEVTFHLDVRRPYAVELAAPVEAPNVAPGTTERVEVEVRSTGTREATWHATWSDEDLPEGWSLTSASSSPFTLASGGLTTLAWDLTVPSTALGDEEGWFDVRVERVGDEESNATVRVPVEVLRTRGLDMEGPDGTATSTGVGQPGQVASAWFSIENLGNAAETTTSIDWSTSAWGTPRVEDAGGQEQYTLTLQPDEFRMLRASVDVPNNVGYGQSISVDLTVCIGEGVDELCRVLQVTFHASRSTVEPPHQRTFPNTTVAYTVDVELPTTGVVKWNSTAFASLPSTWSFAATGADINSTALQVTGAPNSAASFVLEVTMPANAPRNVTRGPCPPATLHLEILRLACTCCSGTM